MSQNNLKRYYGDIDLTVTNNSQTQAFFFLREHCEALDIARPRVLETGCSVGYFSHALRGHGAWVYGVEPFSREAADKGYVDEFFHGTVEDFIRAADPALQQSFDAVILGDVLEHLPDPEATLRALAPFLKPDGIFIVSVPNITHIGVRRMLEQGEWIYQKYGLLDATHIRFFTFRGLRELLVRVGFGITRRFDVLLQEAQVYASAAALACQNESLNAKDHTFQFVVSASKQALAKEAFSDALPRNILVLSSDPLSHTTQLRLLEPLAAYAAEVGGKVRLVRHCSPEVLRWADVLIVHRRLLPDTLETIRRARELGVAVVYDIDELPTELPNWSEALTSITDRLIMEQVMASAGRVTCPTERLREELRKYVDGIAVVPNVITTPGPDYSLSVRHEGADCTLLVTSPGPLTDLLIEAIRRLRVDMPGIELVTVGPVSNALADLATRRYDRCRVDEFARIASGVNNGIGLIPLDGSVYSSCKSPVKWHQYTACGLVTVASAVPPHTECMESGANCLLAANTPEAWHEAMLSLVRDDKRRQLLLARAIRVWQKTASAKIAANAWKEVFRGLPRPLAQTLYAGQVPHDEYK